MVDNRQACPCCKTARQFLLQSSLLLRQKPLFLTSAEYLLLSEPISSLIALINTIANLLMFLIYRTLLPYTSLWWDVSESAIYNLIQLVNSSVSSDLLRDEGSTCTNPDWHPPSKSMHPTWVCLCSELLCMWRTQGKTRKCWGNQKRELILIMLITALYQLISRSLPAVSIKTLHVVFCWSRCLPLLLKSEGSFL